MIHVTASPGTEDLRAEETALAVRCAQGDRAAQHALFHRLKHRVHHTLYRIMGSNRYLPDLIQDTFLEVFRSLSSYRGEARLATWADTVAARVAYRFLSSRPAQTSHLVLVEDLPQSRSDEEARVDARHAVKRLYGILDRIDSKYRIAYALHVIDGRPMSEVAKITRVSIVAAKNRVWRARRMVEERARRDSVLHTYLEQLGGPR